MANKIVSDSALSIFVKHVQVPSTTKLGDLVRQGSYVGLAGDTPYKGQDGKFYVSVDTAALIRVEKVAVALTAGAPVYLGSDGKILAAPATGAVLIGIADRAKAAASADAWIQLVLNPVVPA